MSSLIILMGLVKLSRKLAIWFMYYLLLAIKPKEIMKHIEDQDSLCLDVGAGVGQYTTALRQRGFYNVYPLEPDKNKLYRCNVDLAYCSTAQDIPTRDKYFNLSFAINVLHHTKARLEMLIEMHRVSDKILISELNKNNPLVRIYNRIIGEDTQLLNELELRALMSSAGLRNIRIYQRGLFGIPNVFLYATGV